MARGARDAGSWALAGSRVPPELREVKVSVHGGVPEGAGRSGMACGVGGWGDVLRGRCPVSVHQPGSRLTHAQSRLQAEVGHPRGQLHSQLPRGTEGRPGRPSAACERPRPGRRRFSANSSRPTRSPAPPRVPTRPRSGGAGCLTPLPGWLSSLPF